MNKIFTKMLTFLWYGFGVQGQYVEHALVITGEKPNLAIVVSTFNMNNPAWTKTRVIKTDKPLHEMDILGDAWPKARQLLCKWHVKTWLKKQCSKLGDDCDEKLKVIMKGLVNAESQREYEDLKAVFLVTVGNNPDNMWYEDQRRKTDE
ncbi:LOW QUALITY PROTEIN: hypothetical protein PHMEG_00014875 [Phytophthora megakarya]|uniref:ZSWIM1/3 RNaseH-like domain-containing protein n=1 Tax=Phytophthora megakarya TaxID=4795 RepID=A0A225W3R2_9STRA|nr:LOW QUALITY PROTEIN: hypothetical protein PHMEG_00014875 [Phytophthora megakarya]